MKAVVFFILGHIIRLEWLGDQIESNSGLAGKK